MVEITIPGRFTRKYAHPNVRAHWRKLVQDRPT